VSVFSFSDLAFMGAVGESAALWTPAQITTALWLDAADASTITTISGAVSQWNDKSGNGRNVGQAAAGARPTYVQSGLNGRGTISFNGSSAYLERVGSYLSTNWTCVVAGINNTVTGTPVFVAQSSTLNSQPRWQLDRDSTNARQLHRNDAGTIIFPSQAGHTAASFLQVSTNDGSLIGVSLNGATLTTASSITGSFSTNRLTIGGLYAGSTTVAPASRLNGQIAEFVYVANMLTASDREKLEGYIAHKWGLTVKLPSNHPYKAAAPTV
jgi:hypothetical protein